MSDINTFSDSAVRQIVDTVKGYQQSLQAQPSYRRRNRARGGKGGAVSGSTVQIKITSGSNGIYTGNVIDPATGELGASTTVYATRATAYNISAGKYVVGIVAPVPTMG